MLNIQNKLIANIDYILTGQANDKLTTGATNILIFQCDKKHNYLDQRKYIHYFSGSYPNEMRYANSYKYSRPQPFHIKSTYTTVKSPSHLT